MVLGTHYTVNNYKMYLEAVLNASPILYCFEFQLYLFTIINESRRTVWSCDVFEKLARWKNKFLWMCLVCIFFFFFFISYIFRERNGEKKKNYIPRTFLVVIQKGVSCGHGQTSKIRYTPWQDRRLLLV